MSGLQQITLYSLLIVTCETIFRKVYLRTIADFCAVLWREFDLPAFVCVFKNRVCTHSSKLVLQTVKGPVIAGPKVQTSLEW